MRSTLRIALALVGLAGTAGAAAAQSQSASINATAVVQQPLNVTAGNDLDFGNVLPGVNKAVAPADAGAGSFTIQGQGGYEVALTFTLPANLQDLSANNLAIGSWAGVHNTSNTPAGGTSLTPTALSNANLSGIGELFVFLGATVSPVAAQPAGTYSGTIQLDVAYTGN
jgi:hypothetical protein